MKTGGNTPCTSVLTFLGPDNSMKLLGFIVLLSITLSSSAQNSGATRDTASIQILQMLQMQPAPISLSGTITRTGWAPEPISITVSSTRITTIDEQLANGDHRISTIALGLKNTLGSKTGEAQNFSYFAVPKFDIVEELADPNLGISAPQIRATDYSIRIQGKRSAWPAVYPAFDKTYFIDAGTHDIIAIHDTITAGASTYSHEFTYSNYTTGAGGIRLAQTIVETINGATVSTIQINSIQ